MVFLRCLLPPKPPSHPLSSNQHALFVHSPSLDSSPGSISKLPFPRPASARRPPSTQNGLSSSSPSLLSSFLPPSFLPSPGHLHRRSRNRREHLPTQLCQRCFWRHHVSALSLTISFSLPELNGLVSLPPLLPFPLSSFSVVFTASSISPPLPTTPFSPPSLSKLPASGS